ncbi:MAG: carbonic anhydrase family protein [Rhodospirillaceae bacterium]
MQLQRRSVLSGLAAAAVCPICLSRGASADEPHGHEKHWTYEGEEGPEHWGELKPEFKTCSIGIQQSPVNLAKPVHASLSKLVIDWKPYPVTVTNNGHTIQVNSPPGSTISEEGGEKFNFLQFHFHHPSEHLLDGKQMEMEVHFVHLNEKKDQAIALGIFIVAGAKNEVLEPVFANMPKAKGEIKTSFTIDPNKILPAKLDRFRYEGSLTTPACQEFVHWNVLRQTITASPEQIKAFAALFSNNARPPLPLNRRFLLEG